MNPIKHFGRLLGKIYLFLTPSKTDGRVTSQQGAPITCNLTFWEVSQQTYVQTLLASLGGGGLGGVGEVGRTMGVAKGRNSPIQCGEWGGGGGRFLTNNTWELF